MENEQNFAGKIAIVTGGSRGIGRAIAVRLAREGAQVVIAGRDPEALEAAAGEIRKAGGEATTFAGDLHDPEKIEGLARLAVESHGGIDIVVNNAGASRFGEFVELTEEDWSDGFGLKFFATVRLSRASWPHLKRRRGAVLNIIGAGGRTPGPQMTLAGSVSGALFAFTKALADIGVRDGVQVNAINPGYVLTDRLRGWIASAAKSSGKDAEGFEGEMVRRANIVRLGQPEEIANLAAEILSPGNRFLHGALIDLDGGMTKTV